MLSVLSPAKLNLFLHLYQKRRDGYHDLDTLFVLIDLYDHIHFDFTETTSLRVTNTLSIAEGDDLCFRAASLLMDYASTFKGVHIHVDKKIPNGGGLGGGSSNAATVLCVLNNVFQFGFSQKDLCQMALELGSDVPFFVHGKNAYASGRGEVFLDKPIKEVSLDSFYVVVFPNEHVSTQAVFASNSLTKRKGSGKMAHLTRQDWCNDFESVVLDTYPVIATAKKRMEQFSKAHLTGTGSCLYSVLDDEIKAVKMVNSLKSDYDVFQSRVILKSPILKFI